MIDEDPVTSEETKDLLERARKDSPRPSHAERYQRAIRMQGTGDSTHPGYAIRQNTKVGRRPFSTFNTIMLLFVIGTCIVFYISNVIEVNRLAGEVNDLHAQHEKLRGVNAALQAEISRKSSLERIGSIARESLGLQHPAEQPVVITIDKDKLQELEKKAPIRRNGNKSTH